MNTDRPYDRTDLVELAVVFEKIPGPYAAGFFADLTEIPGAISEGDDEAR